MLNEFAVNFLSESMNTYELAENVMIV
jgi:hypothetical protein